MHKSGDETIRGAKTFINGVTSNVLRQASDDSYTSIFGGSDPYKGAWIELLGKDYPNTNGAGSFEIIASNNDGVRKSLQGYPGGSLFWSGSSFICPNGDLGNSAKKWKTINGLEPSQLSLPSGSDYITITPSYTVGDDITMTASGFLRIQAENTDYELVMLNGDGTVVCSIKKLGCALMIVPVVKGQRFRVTKCEGSHGVYLRLLPSQGNI